MKKQNQKSKNDKKTKKGKNCRIKKSRYEPAIYHVFTRVVQQLFLIADENKEFFKSLLTWLSSTYFVTVLAYNILDNHFHLVLEIVEPEDISEEEIKERYRNYYGKEMPEDTDTDALLERWSDLSKFMQDLNRRFALYMNKLNNRKGHFWASRFRSVILESEEAIFNCVKYVELNAVRANIVEVPEEYPYCSVYDIKNAAENVTVNIKRLQEIFSSQIQEEDFCQNYISHLNATLQDEKESKVYKTKNECFTKARILGREVIPANLQEYIKRKPKKHSVLNLWIY